MQLVCCHVLSLCAVSNDRSLVGTQWPADKVVCAAAVGMCRSTALLWKHTHTHTHTIRRHTLCRQTHSHTAPPLFAF